jgi:hypothetical protein
MTNRAGISRLERGPACCTKVVLPQLLVVINSVVGLLVWIQRVDTSTAVVRNWVL